MKFIKGAPRRPLPEHQGSQENDGHSGSWCFDKAVLARDAGDQKNVCHTSPEAQLS